MRLRLELEYDGERFHGWAAQPGLRTVEGELRVALDTVFPSWGGLAIAGRTDTGCTRWLTWRAWTPTAGRRRSALPQR